MTRHRASARIADMSPRLLRLAAHMLRLAADEFSNHGCNDFELPDDLTDDERRELADLHNLDNFGTIDAAVLAEHEPDDVRTAEEMTGITEDWCLMGALASGIDNLVGESEGDQ